MNIATKNTERFLSSINPSLEGSSFHRALFSHWVNLEKNIEDLAALNPALPIDTDEDLKEMDDVINAQDKIADVACQSQADNFEGLLYKLALWRLDMPDFETLPIDADRKDRIVYSVFMDLIKITGLDDVKTKSDTAINFSGH